MAGKLILRDYIKATVGFEELGAETGTSAKSLIRMFGARGNPQARDFFAALAGFGNARDLGYSHHAASKKDDCADAQR